MKSERNCRQFKRPTNNSEIIDQDTDIYIEVDWNTIDFDKSLDNTVFIGTKFKKETFKGYFSGTEDAATLTFTELERPKINYCGFLGANAVFKVEQVKDVKLINKLETGVHWIKSALKASFKWLGLVEAPPTFKVYVSKN